MRSKGTPRYPRLGALLSAIMSRLGPTRRSIGEHYRNHRPGHQDRQSRADCPQRRDRATLHSCAQIAGMAHVKDDVEAGARMGGTPARRPLPRPSDRPRSTRSRRPHVVGRSGRSKCAERKGFLVVAISSKHRQQRALRSTNRSLQPVRGLASCSKQKLITLTRRPPPQSDAACLPQPRHTVAKE